MTQVYITHGYTANGDKHWFPWLKQQLTDLGISCHTLSMPNPENPNPTEWLDYHQSQIQLTEDTILVGHSLGCIATLNLLASTQQKVKGVILVSGFFQCLPTLPELDNFANTYATFYANLGLNSTAYPPKNTTVIASVNDEIVPHSFSDHLALHLKADYIRLPQGGHFLDREGITEFPLVLNLIKALL